MYKVNSISKERWIFISADNSFDELDTFITLLKAYQATIDGKISQISANAQYIIESDPLNLVFQWDSLFGITVVVPLETDISVAQGAMTRLCNKLNCK